MKATLQLMKEHDDVLLMLKILDSAAHKLEDGIKVNPLHFEAIIDFLKNFVDKCHHGKEEKLLFPALEHKGIPNEGGPVGVMLAEHVQGRKFIKGMSDAVTAYRLGNATSVYDIDVNAQGYRELLNQHISQKNNVLFKMADSKLSEGEQDLLWHEFEKLEASEFGPNKHEQYQTMLLELKEIYL